MENHTFQERWDNRSSIRTSPRKIIDFTKEGYFFPAAKQALLLIPQVKKLGNKVKFEILLYSFYKYLNDIVTLESSIIINACNMITYKKFEFCYTDEIKLDAYTIIIDEYYHIYLAQDMIQQLEKQYPNLIRLKYNQSDAYNALSLIKEKISPNYHDIFEIIAVCIFETTLVRELVEFFKDSDVHPSVRYYVNDHMNDESRHYKYFYDILIYTWSNLSETIKNTVGKYLGEFVVLYLNVLSEKEY